VKIILVHNRYQQPGGEDVVFEQEKQLLQQRGHKVITYVRDNFEVHSYEGIRRLELASKTVWARDSRSNFSRLLRRERPDLVHVHNTFLMISPSVYAACTEAQVPVVQTLHNYRLLCPAATFFRHGSVCEECVAQTLWRSVKHGCYRESRPATATVALMLAFHRLRQTWSRDVASYIALSEFARKKSAVLKNYVRSVIHGICWMKHRRQEAMKVVTGEPMRRMKISDAHEMERHFDAIVSKLQIKPYPTLEALSATYEIACQEYGAKGLNPLALWGMHWVKELDDEGFIDALIQDMT